MASFEGAEQIRSPRTLADKPGVKQGMRIAILDVDDAGRTTGLTYTKVVRFSETDTAEMLLLPRTAR